MTDTDRAISELRALCDWYLVYGVDGSAWVDVCKALGCTVQDSFNLFWGKTLSRRKTNAIVARYMVLRHEAAKEALGRMRA